MVSVIDVVGILSETANPKRYWSDLKRKLAQEAGSGQPYEKIVRLKLTAPDGKLRDTDVANTETLFRVIQSIPSPKAEPFKRWLAQVGYERVKEIEDPELASARARELYEAKGYPKDWIEKRMRAIAIWGGLTDEWKARGVAEGIELGGLFLVVPAAGFLHPSIVEDETLDQVFPQVGGGPLPELGAAQGAHPVAHGQDHVEVVVLEGAFDLTRRLLANL